MSVTICLLQPLIFFPPPKPRETVGTDVGPLTDYEHRFTLACPAHAAE